MLRYSGCVPGGIGAGGASAVVAGPAEWARAARQGPGVGGSMGGGVRWLCGWVAGRLSITNPILTGFGGRVVFGGSVVTYMCSNTHSSIPGQYY